MLTRPSVLRLVVPSASSSRSSRLRASTSASLRELPDDIRFLSLPVDLCETIAYIARLRATRDSLADSLRHSALLQDSLRRASMNRITKVDPSDYVPIVGSTFAKHDHLPLLVIGSRTWDRWALGRLGCPHPVAAASLNRVIQELRITTMAGLARNVHEVGRYKGLGVTAYWLVIALLRADGYDVKELHGTDVTYNTLKVRARAALKEKRRKPRRAGPPSESKTA